MPSHWWCVPGRSGRVRAVRPRDAVPPAARAGAPVVRRRAARAGRRPGRGSCSAPGWWFVVLVFSALPHTTDIGPPVTAPAATARPRFAPTDGRRPAARPGGRATAARERQQGPVGPGANPGPHRPTQPPTPTPTPTPPAKERAGRGLSAIPEIPNRGDELGGCRNPGGRTPGAPPGDGPGKTPGDARRAVSPRRDPYARRDGALGTARNTTHCGYAVRGGRRFRTGAQARRVPLASRPSACAVVTVPAREEQCRGSLPSEVTTRGTYGHPSTGWSLCLVPGGGGRCGAVGGEHGFVEVDVGVEDAQVVAVALGVDGDGDGLWSPS